MRTAVVLLALAACKGQDGPPKSAPAPAGEAAPGDAARADAAATATDWTVACAEALRAAPKQTPARRVTALIDGCRPCGDWTPLLRWKTPKAEGGPSTAAIEDAMIACKAYCSADARRDFTATLEPSRDKATQKPWRVLGDACKGEVSALPDARFMSAPYFALDRIARAAAAVPSLAPLLDQLALPLPAVSVTGVGFELPHAPVMKPDAGTFHVTVSPGEIRIGALPRATLGADGVRVEAGDVLYPGEAVAPKQLAAALAKLTSTPDATITLIAPAGLPAARLVDVVAATAPRQLVLAAAANGAPVGWTLPGTVPVALVSKAEPAAAVWRLSADADVDAQITVFQRSAAGGSHVIQLGETVTVAALAKFLGALAYRDVQSVALQRAPKTPAKRP